MTTDRTGLAADLLSLVRANRELSTLLSAEELDQLLLYGVLRTVEEGEAVPAWASDRRSAFVVLAGTLTPDGEGDGEGEGEPIGPGDLIGGLSLIGTRDSQERARAQSPCILLQIPAEIANDVFERSPRLLQRFFQRYRSRILHDALRGSRVFGDLDRDALDALAGHAQLSGWGRDTEILVEGEPGDTFHVVVDGLAAVQYRAGDRRLNLALLRAGDHFGEWALLSNAPRAATVCALTRLIAIGVEREPLLGFLSEHPRVRERVDQMARARYEEAAAFIERVESSAAVEAKLAAIRRALRAAPSGGTRR